MLGCAGADEHVRSSKHSVICRSCSSSHIWPVAARPVGTEAGLRFHQPNQMAQRRR